jgi:ParB-like chromosome segregation protein Spo0J
MKEAAVTRTERSVSLGEISTDLGRVRCPQPNQIARMRQSLSTHGQMTAVIAVEREQKLVLVDGFKRLRAASEMSWKEMWVNVRSLDERGQWAVMLTLNRTPGALSVLEESMILRELIHRGLSQTEIAEMVGRHKSWVSRRIGLIERLHADLVEWVKTGMMSAAMAQRLMVLPHGNQLEMAAVVTQSELTVLQAELLVNLWQKAKEPAVRRFLLTEPRRAIDNAQAETNNTAIDPRLGPRGKALAKALPMLRGLAMRVSESLHPTPPETSDLKLLAPQLDKTQAALAMLSKALGFASTFAKREDRSEGSETRTFAD